ncbi:MAG: hypothetical protein ACRDTT_21130 [Pseudonocardiaceae bacterium]
MTPGLVLENRRQDLARIFGEPVDVIQLSHYHCEPRALAEAVRAAEPDAVVYGTATAAHWQAIQDLALDAPVLRTRFEHVRNNRGEAEDRPVGLGIVRVSGEVELLADGALAERSAIKRAPHGQRQQGG